MKKIHLLMATQTGNAEDAASQARKALTTCGHDVEWVDLALRRNASFLTGCDIVLAVVSTWGAGEPPDDAVPFFESLRAAEPMGLGHVAISVLALGDSSYDRFCESGRELERELLRHGATLLAPRVDCDDLYDDGLEQWLGALKGALARHGERIADTV